MTKRDAELRQLNPVDLEDVERVTNRPIFDELRRSLLDGETGSDTEGRLALPRLRRQAPYHQPAAMFAVAATILLVVGLVVFVGGGSGLARPVTSPWHSGHPFAIAAKPSTHKGGWWRLVDDLLSGTWRQNTSGPPPGYLDCPSTSACYVMSGRYPSAMPGAPLLSESLYVSTDLGSTWSVLPMPSGFAPTTPLTCGGPSDCEVGGTYNGQSVLVTTSDGGHTFTIDPLPSGVGTLYQLSCPTSRFCGGLVATSANENDVPIDATFLSTNDGGANFTDAPIEAGDSIQEIACTTNLNCTVVGTNDAVGMNDWTAGVAAVTTDGGQNWATGVLPAGFGVSYLSTLSCADALHCLLTGDIAITIQNPPECATIHNAPVVRPPTATVSASTNVPSAAVQAIAKVESK